MRIKNREILHISAKQLNHKLGSITQNDVELTADDIFRETSLCLALSDELANYAQYLNNPSNYTYPDTKDQPDESH